VLKYAACVARRLHPCASFVRGDGLSVHIYIHLIGKNRGVDLLAPRLAFEKCRFEGLRLIGNYAQGSLVVRYKIPRPFPADRIAWVLSVPLVENLIPLRVGML